jgi:flagellar hook protein FlgE
MSLNSALLSGVSGLSANSAALAAISDNISNVNTVAYKRNATNFQTLVTSNSNLGSYNAGGVISNTHAQISQQGNLQQTSSATDLGIAGQGFFIVTDKAEGVMATDTRSFTRAGSFTPDTQGYLRNNAGLYLQGWPVDASGLVNSDPSDLTRLAAINIAATGGTASSTTRVAVNANLQAGQAITPQSAPNAKPGVVDSAAVTHDFTVDYQPTATAGQWNVTVKDAAGFSASGVVTFNTGTGAIVSSTLPGGSTATLTLAPSANTVTMASLGLNNWTDASAHYNPLTNNMASYNPSTATGVKPDYSLQIPVIDSKGGKRTLELDFLKSSTPNQWYAELRAVPASDIVSGPGLVNGQVAAGIVAFTPDARYDPTNSTLFPSSANPVINFGASASGAPAAGAVNWDAALGIGAQDVRIDLGQLPGGITQFASQSVTQSIVSDGTSFGNLTNIEINESGFVTANFDNGVSRKIAQVALATFPNPDGMRPVSGNAYRVALESGTYNIKVPGTGGAGSLSPSTLEASSVDLSQEFTGLITTQRAYAASSKIITTADQMMEELLNMKR